MHGLAIRLFAALFAFVIGVASHGWLGHQEQRRCRNSALITPGLQREFAPRAETPSPCWLWRPTFPAQRAEHCQTGDAHPETGFDFHARPRHRRFAF